jgi:hypothetical protein
MPHSFCISEKHRPGSAGILAGWIKRIPVIAGAVLHQPDF